MGTRTVPPVRGILGFTSKMTVSQVSSISSSVCWLIERHTYPKRSMGVTAAKKMFGLRTEVITSSMEWRLFGMKVT